ncbi:MAG: FG-GAP-like repeat-containing protein [Planctomycetota bacterium]
MRLGHMGGQRGPSAGSATVGLAVSALLCVLGLARVASASQDAPASALPGEPHVGAGVAARLALEHASDDEFEHESLTTDLAGRFGAALGAFVDSGDTSALTALLAPDAAVFGFDDGAVAEARAALDAAPGLAAQICHSISSQDLPGTATDGVRAPADAAAQSTAAQFTVAQFTAALRALPGVGPWKVKVLRSERAVDDPGRSLVMTLKLAPRPSLDRDATRAGLARVELEWTRASAEGALSEGEADDAGALWRIRVARFEELDLVRAPVGLEDVTAQVLESSPEARDQLIPSIPSLGLGLDATLGVGFLGHHGLAVADVNGDGIDDLYLCQPGGLPDQLWVRRADGTAVEVAAALGLDLLDTSSSALFVDLDNDGDQDLVRCTASEVVVHVNRGGGTFPEAFAQKVEGATSLAAADVDLDGLVDVFLCTYGSPYTGGGLPLPFQDARNGTQNLLLANRTAAKDKLAFEDVTEAAGLGGSDQRFSFTASFEDFDGDGDQDLYIANDFGRNNLWRNERLPDGPARAGAAANAPFRFVDVAPELGVEDLASGMGVTWADFDLDGRSDLYVSNMFSSAGNRIAFDARFQPDASPEARGEYRRHAAGNSMFLARDGGFTYTGEAALGLWAWGGLAFELDGDGWPDLYVPNGFVTGTNPDDL